MEKIYNYPTVPIELNELSNVPLINIEFIGDKIIEVHLRDSPDPDYDTIIPVWVSNAYSVEEYAKKGYSFVFSFEDADGFLKDPRIGFMVKNKE